MKKQINYRLDLTRSDREFKAVINRSDICDDPIPSHEYIEIKTAVDLELVTELSNAGEVCLYHADVESQPGTENVTITDIAMQNPTNYAVEFGSAATFVIRVNEVQ